MDRRYAYPKVQEIRLPPGVDHVPTQPRTARPRSQRALVEASLLRRPETRNAV